MTQSHPVSHPWRLIALLVVAILGLSLLNPGSRAQEVPPSALATQFFDAVGGDTPAYLFSNGAVLHTPEGTFTGVTAPAQFGAELGHSFSDVEFTVQSTAGAANGWVIASFALTGINTGAYHGAEANCAGISVPGVALFHLTEEQVVPDWWASQPGNHTTQPPTTSVLSVSEQWVNYDADAVANQIAVFNALDPNVRPGCDDFYNAVAAGADAGTAPAYEPPPSCLSPDECALAY